MQLSYTLLSLLKLTGWVFDLSISIFSTYDFQLDKSTFLGKSDVSAPILFSKSDFVA